MAKVVQLEIHHFRKFEDYSCTFGRTNLVCLIGRGDSGKTTILEALSYVLSPSRILPISDYDFSGCKIEDPIRIRAVVVDFDEVLLRSDKYGYYQSAWDCGANVLCDIQKDGAIPALVVEFSVDSSLEPKWEIENQVSGERKPVGFKDRALLNATLISDFINRHFAWSNGSPLTTLTHEGGERINLGALQEISRSVRDSAENVSFGNFDDVLSKVGEKAAEYGLETGNLVPAFDVKQMAIREGAVCLHDQDRLPLRLRGKGSKRLLSAAIQSSVTGDTGITLIDEVEQGLEPDRVRSFVHKLMQRTAGQVFLTTHSQNVLVEVNAENVFWVRGGDSAYNIPRDHQGIVRSLPAAFFGKRIILCEGKTEVGFCKGLDEFLDEKGKNTLARSGVVLVIGRGNNFKPYADAFLDMGVRIMLFCDSDNDEQNEWKKDLSERGVQIVSWKRGESIEEAVVNELPDAGVKSFLNRALGLIAGGTPDVAMQDICNAVRASGATDDANTLFEVGVFGSALRKCIGKAAKGPKGRWFKSEPGGAALARLVCEYGKQLDSNGSICRNISLLMKWINDD